MCVCVGESVLARVVISREKDKMRYVCSIHPHCLGFEVTVSLVFWFRDAFLPELSSDSLVS